ncbi:MAG TPA: ankyrin repeat domain-containing protein [Pyrinomonadaceae bacterium]|nr:ankyrin repeat domain-containing protein [Pyrinomonadaceae bacterium]
MASKLFLKNLSIPSPCEADWNSMKGNDQVRFCEHCELSVHNLSKMTRHQAERLVSRANGRLCVQFVSGENGKPLLAEAGMKLHRISRRVSRIAAGAFTATLSVSSAAAHSYQSCPSRQFNSAATISQPTSRLGMSSVVGKVTDQNGAVISGATVALSNDQSKVILYASSDDSGQFKFPNLEPGLYRLRFEAPGFAGEDAGTVYLQATGETRIDRTLKVAELEANLERFSRVSSSFVSGGGVVAFVAPAHPFVRAAQEDNLEGLAALISETDVNMRDTRSRTTALEHAVRNANREMVQFLLAAGADPNAKDATGQTVLMELDEDATVDMVWDLINSGAKVNLQDLGGNTPLMELASSKNVEAIKALLDAGAKLETRNKQGRTALMVAAIAGHVNTVRALILAGADITALDKENKDALAHAIEENNKAVVRLLKSRGALETLAQNEAEEDEDEEDEGDDEP